MHAKLAVTVASSCILSDDDLGALARKEIGKICARHLCRPTIDTLCLFLASAAATLQLPSD